MTENKGETSPPRRSASLQLTWMITTGFSTLAALIIIVNIVVVAANGLGKIVGWPPLFHGFDHMLWLLMAGLCAIIAIAAHLVKLRAGQLATLVYPVELEEPVVAETRGGSASEQFRSLADITIELTTPDLVEPFRSDMAVIRKLLEKGLSIATSDPVDRYSKSRIEEVLKICLAERYKLSHIHRVVLTSMRQERMVPNFASVKGKAPQDPTAAAMAEITASAQASTQASAGPAEAPPEEPQAEDKGKPQA